MKSFQFSTCFGNVTGHYAEDVCEFESNECTIIGMDADSDGPQWEDDSHDWATLNDLCHRIADKNIYGVADGIEETLIDSTDSYDEMSTWKAWVTDNPSKLYESVKEMLLEAIRYEVNKEMLNLNDENLGLSDVREWSKEVYDHMKDNSSDFIDAYESVAESKGYEVA